MKESQVNPIHHLCLMLCFFILATAGCQQEKRNEVNNNGESAAAASEQAGGRNTENAIVPQDNNGSDYNPDINPANFAGSIDNPYLTLTPGRVWLYEGQNEDGETERVEIAVTADTKAILGVNTTVVREREWVNGELVEDTFDWFAQDKEGNVWYFGEESKEIEDGEVVSTKGSWEAGVDGAKPGILMKANPRTGDTYRQEFLKGEAEDMGRVLSTDETVGIRLGSYENCVQIQDWSPLEPKVIEHKFYCKAVGNLVLERKVAGESGEMELIEMRSESAPAQQELGSSQN
jgi:hypothetical protein